MFTIVFRDQNDDDDVVLDLQENTWQSTSWLSTSPPCSDSMLRVAAASFMTLTPPWLATLSTRICRTKLTPPCSPGRFLALPSLPILRSQHEDGVGIVQVVWDDSAGRKTWIMLVSLYSFDILWEDESEYFLSSLSRTWGCFLSTV